MKKVIFILLCLIPSLVSAQVLDYIDIRLNILEKVGKEIQPLPNAKLNITDLGEVSTDEKGQKTFTYPIRNNVDPQISISLISDELRTLKPLDASIAVDTSREEMYIEFLVVNMANESEAFKKRINSLEKRVTNLKAKNQLTQQQLRAMSTQLLDTILYYESVKAELQDEIENLEDLTEEQRQQIEAQNDQISQLEDRVDDLTEKLAVALEERYLRQKKYFDEITGDLRSYIRKSKDIQDHLPNIQAYCSSPGGMQNYGDAINSYNKTYEKLDEKRAGYLEGVENYWENKKVLKDLEETFDYALRTIHIEAIKTPLSDIYSAILIPKPKKAQKIATTAYENLLINLPSLERMINRVELNMRNNL